MNWTEWDSQLANIHNCCGKDKNIVHLLLYGLNFSKGNIFEVEPDFL